ncbi:hypothetical protein CDAR_572921 [Caerostris darwini]|uniref:Hexosyltransferase n=1 Tax=Caerostris darwini TaxID=1538125 RepID=A0AAV4W7M0_9ARAC|nr:hypothetical protein CDAR_572921 [Caerostris darwini]
MFTDANNGEFASMLDRSAPSEIFGVCGLINRWQEPSTEGHTVSRWGPSKHDTERQKPQISVFFGVLDVRDKPFFRRVITQLEHANRYLRKQGQEVLKVLLFPTVSG